MLKAVLFILFVALNVVFAKVDDFEVEAQNIKNLLNQSIETYKSGKALEAKKLAENAYFQHFENLEGTIGRNMGKKAFLMERKFNSLRKLYQNNADLERIEALIAGLFFDIDEVLPVLKDGFKLVAEASDINYDKKKAEEDSLKAEAKRRAEAEAMFASLLGDSTQSSDTQTNTQEQIANTKSEDSAKDSAINSIGANSSAEFQQAAGLHPKLYFLYETISGKFDIAAMKFQRGDLDLAADLIENAQFNDYRNTKLEVAINKNVSSGGKIQQNMREIVRQIRSKSIDEKTLREKLSSLSDEIFDVLLQIPSEEVANIRVEGFDENVAMTKDYSKVADDIKIALNNLLDDYSNKGITATIDTLQGIYLDIFEASGMENKIGAVSNDLKLKIEAQFTKGVALIKANAPKEKLKECFDELNVLIESSLSLIQDSSPWFLFLSSLSIILREGLEAMLIVVAIVAYLIQSGNQNRSNIVYSALGAGVFLSFITAFAVYYLFREYAGQFRELLEGITMLIAVALLLYVGFWLLTKANKWHDFIKSQAKEAISKGSIQALWWSVFLAVYREGAETVLFYQALLFDSQTSSDYSAVFGGLLLGCLILIVLYFAIKAGAVKIPIKLFFKATSYIIFIMCFSFTGKGVAELIEGKIITPTLIPYSFEAISWLGIFPYYESLIPQICIIIFIIIGIVLTKRITRSKETKM